LQLSELVVETMHDATQLTMPPAPEPDVEILGLTSDSREVEPGFLFAALQGSQTDGKMFIDRALERGAVAVLVPPGEGAAAKRSHVRFIQDNNPRRRFALMAARFFGSQPRTVIAVTGTNGKTSVVEFTRQIWSLLGRPAASLGTLGSISPKGRLAGALTTPDPVVLQRTLAELAREGINHLAIEASSHGLDQYRLDGVRIAAAAFTNLSRDHLDYHGTPSAYRQAKLRLFRELLPPGAIAVLNADDRACPAFRKACAAAELRVMTFGTENADGVDFVLAGRAPTASGQRLDIRHANQRFEVETPLIGAFQASNLLCALALVVACGAEMSAAAAVLGKVSAVAGRMQRVARRNDGAAIYIDYAHTPDALAKALGALRPHARGRLLVVFGCGGDRDAGKRPEMGAVAKRLADRVIVTDDNPRTESPAEIRRQILGTCPGAQEIGDRAEAIRSAVAELEAGDVLVIAGKGHEPGQIIGDRIQPFDDTETARRAAAELWGTNEAVGGQG
jgi:UDP-N-acetylmuramoyl-L-alanyl-D-glutamate--2,6-diaminopimelate ligase